MAGLTLGFGLLFFGFLVVAGEHFAMWQAAFRLTTVILGMLIFCQFARREWRKKRLCDDPAHLS